MNYEEALVYLSKLASEKKFFADKKQPSLKEVNRVLDLLGRPDKTFKNRVIVGGTAGKGTVCRYVEQTLISEGGTVAVLSSPELQVINERIRLNGRLVSKKDFAAVVGDIKEKCKASDLNLTYYEFIVVAGILIAAKYQVENLICEVGLGGEFDAVNAVQGERVAALTFIGDDHREILGPKLENIAETKAGIFTRDSVLNLSCEQKYRTILDEKSNSKILYMKGIKQKLNKKLARKICEQILGSNEFAMAKPKLPARWEKVRSDVVLEGAHSAPRFEYLVETKLKKNKGPYTLVLGMQKNHNPKAFDLLKPYAARIIWTQVDSSAHQAEALKKEHQVGEVVKNPLEAIKKAQEFKDPILVTGSFYLCGVLRETFYDSQKMLDQQTEFPE